MSKQVKYLLTKSVSNRQNNFFSFIIRTKFNENLNKEIIEDMLSSNFDSILEEDTNIMNLNSHKEVQTMEEIFNSELIFEGFYSNIIKHKSIYNPNEITKEYIVKVSKDLGRTYFIEHFFLWFEEYFTKFLKTEEVLMKKDGFLPKTWRYYIAIMAVSSMKCEYMFKALEESFLEEGGDQSWLIYGLNVIPEKLARLSTINNVLAHQAWKIETDDLKELTTKRDQNDTAVWNLGELIQATLIMIHYHKLAIISDALNLKLKKKTKSNTNLHNLQNIQTLQNSENFQNHQNNVFIDIGNIANLLNQENININFTQILNPNLPNPTFSYNKTQNNTIKDTILKNLEDINKKEETQETSPSINLKELHSTTKSGFDEDLDRDNPLETLTAYNIIDFDKHIIKTHNFHLDFDPHSEDYRSYLEFNWNDHAFYILHNLFPCGVDSLNAEIEYISSLTTNSLGEEYRKLNTFPIRYAISCYIEKINGYIHEDYDYSYVNKLVDIEYKKFIKKLACYPKRLTKEDFELMCKAFNCEEILHIILLVSLVKSRTQLTYLASSLYEIIKNID